MRIMGQDFYNPPNVRGWLYGEYWINSTTISGRRQVVDYLFSKIKEKNLNGNEKRDLKRAREEERGDFLVTDERLNQVLDTAVDDLAEHFTSYFITEHSRQTYLKPMQQLMSATDSKTSIHHIRNAIIALLQSPAYNLS
jgi:chromatin remodeling complex protein RSC6